MLFQKTLEKMRKGEGGFTLIELLIVMVIIGLLAAIAIPLFLSQKAKARETALKNDLRNAATYAEEFAVDNNGAYQTALAVPFSLTGTEFKKSDSVDTVAVNAAKTDADEFCIEGTVNGAAAIAWSYDSNRPTGPQLAKGACA